jgi:hypothetical protein
VNPNPPSLATHLKIELDAINTAEVKAGDTVTLKISARQADETVCTDYLNLVGFTNTDAGSAAIPDYRFLGTEPGGIKYLPIILKTIGDQVIEVRDREDANIVKAGITLSVYEVRTIGKSGGIITNPDGTEIVIPADPLAPDRELAIRKTKNPPLLPVSYQYKCTAKPISRDFGELDRSTIPWTLKHVNFASIVNIKLPYTKSEVGEIDELALRVFYYDDAKGKYVIVPGAQEISGGKVIASSPHFSTFRIIGTYLATSLSNVIGYPSPFSPNTAFNHKFKVINLPADAEMNIYTIAGEKVKTLQETEMQFPNSGYIDWDGKNEAGETVANGVYLYLVKTPDGSKKTGKIGIVK